MKAQSYEVLLKLLFFLQPKIIVPNIRSVCINNMENSFYIIVGWVFLQNQFSCDFIFLIISKLQFYLNPLP